MPLLISFISVFLLINDEKREKINECESLKQTNYERNKLNNRVKILVNPSNEPCEDRFNCYQFKNLNGFYSAVFDGHGGWQVSELAMKKMHLYIDEEIGKHKSKGD
jgi:hypothetical protein